MRNKGITLVALVVTIIIMLILAGVTISQIGGNNGLFSKVKQAVEQYKNASLDEESSLKEIEKHLSEFEILGGDKTDEGVKVKIINFEANPEGKNIKAVVTIEGTASKIEYSLDGETWVRNEDNEKNTEYTFKEVKIGSYNVRVRVYDEEEKKTEAMSKLITIVDTITANAEEVLEGRTYYDGNRELQEGTMTNHGGNDIEITEAEQHIPKGYYNGEGVIRSNEFFIASPKVKVMETCTVSYSAFRPASKLTITFKNTYTKEDRAFIYIQGVHHTSTYGALASVDDIFIIGNTKDIDVESASSTSGSTGYFYIQVLEFE